MTDIESDERLWELYHINSKNSGGSGLDSKKGSRKTGALNAGFSFQESTKFALPPPISNVKCDLMDAMRSRRSTPPTCMEKMPAEFLSAILFAANGVVSPENSGRKTTPSAGALYPIDIFMKLRQCELFQDGIYYYVPQDHSLAFLSQAICGNASEVFLQDDLDGVANIELFMCASFGRLSDKYGERGYRYCFLEAGHIAQNVLLVATALGLSSCSFGGFIDDVIEDSIGIDGVRQSIIYSCMVGH